MGKQKKRNFDELDVPPPDDLYVISAEEQKKLKKCASKRPPFTHFDENCELAMGTKMAALSACPFVVSLVSFSGTSVLTQSCGSIIKTDYENNNTVITSLNLIRKPTEADFVDNELAPDLKIIARSSDDNWYISEICTHDFHYNLLILKFKSATPLQSAELRMMDDDPNLDVDDVIVVGRYFSKPYDVMAAPGLFKKGRCKSEEYECTELLSSSCNITRCGDGAPLVNLSGEVIGIVYFELGATTPFLPINIAYKWWNHYKKYGDSRHPSYGFEGSNLCYADFPTLEKILKIFPDISNGILVEKVKSGSYAETAGLREKDVIAKCDDVIVKSFFQLWDDMWGKVGHVVKLEVAQPNIKITQIINMEVGEATTSELNKWPRYDFR